MTVEQNAIQQHCQKHQQTLLNQLREITGTTDVRLLQQALRFCSGDLAGAVAYLTERSAQVPEQNEDTCSQTLQSGSDRSASMPAQTGTDAVGQAGKDKDELRRAVPLSLEDSCRETGVTDEEQIISRVLEVCIAENKARLKWTRAEVWQDPPNPYDRKREGNRPVGLKNVGNTCWFSAVIQSLFHLLEFQKLVLHYSPSQHARNLPYNQKVTSLTSTTCPQHVPSPYTSYTTQEHRNLLFMQELRRLFSLMVASKRKYVDPTRAVQILKDAFKSSESQQDVSEFTHKLLDWLEDAFQVKAEEGREGEHPENPMVELFYGRFSAVGVLEGKRFENTEMFGQYPLQVNGFKNLHECLEAAMIEGEIESLHSENSAKSGQEHWFTKLPPVLTFELSRFEFNQVLGRPEKIHNRLEFPPVLYLDRYMEKNKDITRTKREEIRRLKENLTTLQQRLERYFTYGSGSKRWPLAEVLEYAMEFASSKPVSSSPLQDVNGSCAPPSGPTLQLLQPPSTPEQGPAGNSDVSGIAYPAQQRAPVHKPFTQSHVSLDMPAYPAPRHVTEEETVVLEACLQRWRSEVDSDSCALQRSISRLHRTIDLMYSDKAMMKVPYRLHAVLVHEGQASAGHYWAYVYSPCHRCWLKYNDVSVTKSSWEELMRDSFGGYRSASAYCLVYVDGRKPFLVEEEFDEETGQPLRGMEKLPEDLRTYVEEDNRRFEEELRQWDLLKEKLMAAVRGTAGSMPGPPCRTVGTGPDKVPAHQEPPSHMCDTEHLRADKERDISQLGHEQDGRNPHSQLNTITTGSSSSCSQPEALADPALKTPNTLLYVTEWEVGKPTTNLPSNQRVIRPPMTTHSTGQSVVNGPSVSPLPEFAAQGMVNSQVAINPLAQGVTQRLASSSQAMAKDSTLVPYGHHSLEDKPTAFPPHVESVVEVSMSLPPDTQFVVELSSPTHSDTWNMEMASAALPSDTEAVIEVSDAPAPVVEAVVQVSDAPPPVAQALVQVSDALPPVAQALVQVSDAPPPVAQALVQVSDAPPPVAEAGVKLSDALPPVAQTVVEVSDAPPPVAQTVVEQSDAPPPVAQTVVELSDAPPPVAQTVVEVSDAPPPVAQTVVEQSDAPPPVAQTVVTVSGTLPPDSETDSETVIALSAAPPTDTEAVLEMSPGSPPDVQAAIRVSAPVPPDASSAVGLSVSPPPVAEEGSQALSTSKQCVLKVTSSPDVDTSVTLSQEAGDDDEAMLSPTMHGIVMAINGSRGVYEKCGPEDAFFKAIKMEYVRLLHLACEDTPPEYDPRLHYIMVYLIQNQAPKKILERTLLTQFASQSLAFDERCKQVMKVAREKLSLIKPDEVNMEEYQIWHQDYENFRETTIFLLIGLELFLKRSYIEALTYLIHSYQYNKVLIAKGPYRGHDEDLIALYRRECLLRLSEHAAALFESGVEPEVSEGLNIMSELVAPCLPLLLADETEEKDVVAVEVMRNRWCSYLGQEMAPRLQEMLTDFLPRLLDCSVEIKCLCDPPHLPSWSTLELCTRFSRVMTSLCWTLAAGR